MAPGAGCTEGHRRLKVNARQIVEGRIRERRALIDRAERFAASLGPDLGVLAVVVFGSVARGDFNLWSDVDVLVIVRDVDDRLVERVRSAGSEIGLVQPVLWTSEQLRSRHRRKDPIAVESLDHGVWLVGTVAEVLGDPGDEEGWP